MLTDQKFWLRAGATAGRVAIAMLAVQGVLAYWRDTWPLTDLIIITSGMILIATIVEVMRSKRRLKSQLA